LTSDKLSFQTETLPENDIGDRTRAPILFIGAFPKAAGKAIGVEIKLHDVSSAGLALYF
jgi:hypothetical protein